MGSLGLRKKAGRRVKQKNLGLTMLHLPMDTGERVNAQQRVKNKHLRLMMKLLGTCRKFRAEEKGKAKG